MIVQEALTAKVAPQVPPAAPAGREKGCGVPPPKVKTPPAKAVVPVLVTVTVIAALVVRTSWLPNASVVGDTLALPVVAAPLPNSTAPGSKCPSPPVSGLGLPKKSVAG